MKKNKLINIFLIILILSSLFLQGCNRDVNQYEIENKKSTSTAEQKKPENSYGSIDIQSFFMLHKDELLEKYGNEYKKMQIGPEGYYDGYYYKKLGLTFGYGNNLLEYIKCDNEVLISGIKNGMGFTEIEQKWGESKVNREDIENSSYWRQYDFNGYSIEIESHEKEGNSSQISILRRVELIETTENNIREYFNMSEDEFLKTMNAKYHDIVDDAGQGNDKKGYYFEELSLVFIFNNNGILETIEPRYVFYFRGIKIEPTFESVERTLGLSTEQKFLDNEKKIKEISYYYNGFKINCISANDNSPFCRIYIYKTDNPTISENVNKKHID